jgi:hypothetical protein
MRFVSIRSSIGFLEQGRVSKSLDIDRIPHHKGVFGDRCRAALNLKISLACFLEFYRLLIHQQL